MSESLKLKARPPMTLFEMTSSSYADQLLEGITNAIDLEIWDVAESLARTLAQHIRRTGEYPQDLPREQMERLVLIYEQSSARGLN